MARKLRVQYPGAMYHVMNRGDHREAIFADDPDRHRFLKTLGEVCDKTCWQVHAYCLMSNHFQHRKENGLTNFIRLLAFMALVSMSGVSCRNVNSFCAVRPGQPSENFQYRTPTALAAQIASANNVVATNWSAAAAGERGVSTRITGHRARRLLSAVVNARAYRNEIPTGSIFDWQLKFYQAEKLLGAVRFQESGFLADGGEFHDRTGVLASLYTELVRHDHE